MYFHLTLDIEQIYAESQKEKLLHSNVDLKNKKGEFKAFYSGDSNGMDAFQRKLKDKKYIHWQDWEMVLVFPNPDFKKDNYKLSVKECKKVFKKCFKGEKLPN